MVSVSSSIRSWMWVPSVAAAGTVDEDDEDDEEDDEEEEPLLLSPAPQARSYSARQRETRDNEGRVRVRQQEGEVRNRPKTRPDLASATWGAVLTARRACRPSWPPGGLCTCREPVRSVPRRGAWRPTSPRRYPQIGCGRQKRRSGEVREKGAGMGRRE
jgi:hypothetical protein